MSRFVEECLKEWNRLGVAQITANEMAADLEADLAEAEADGVSPEEVLGNGYFDARGFAAEWASARGVVHFARTTRPPVSRSRLRPLAVVLSALGCLLVAAIGLAILVGGRASSVSIAVASFPRPVPRSLPRMFLRGGPFGSVGTGAPIAVLGLLLFVSGLVGAGVMLWLWKRRATHPDSSELDRGIGMPTYF